MILVHGSADRLAEHRGDHRRQLPPGGVTGRDQRHIALGDAEVGPPKAQRVEDLGGQDLADFLAGGRVDDLTHQRTPGQRVVDVYQSGPI